MTTQQTKPCAGSAGSEQTKPAMTALGLVIAVALLAVIGYHARIGAVSDRIRNPAVSGAPRPAHFPLACGRPNPAASGAPRATRHG